MVAVKNSTKRQAAASPARPIAEGSASIPARVKSRGDGHEFAAHGRKGSLFLRMPNSSGIKKIGGVNLIVSLVSQKVRRPFLFQTSFRRNSPFFELLPLPGLLPGRQLATSRKEGSCKGRLCTGILDPKTISRAQPALLDTRSLLISCNL